MLDASEVIIKELSHSIINVYKMCFEEMGYDLGATNNEIEYRNYLYEDPILLKSKYVDMTDPDMLAPVEGSALDRAVIVANILISKGGFSKEQAAAIVGVFIDENHCNPASYMAAEKKGQGASGTGVFGYGAGIGSWTGEKYKNTLLQLIGQKPYTPIESLPLETQAEMVVQDSIHGPNSRKYKALKTCDNLADASATCVCITSGHVWRNPHPIPEDAKKVADIYGMSNDKRFGPSPYHWNLDKRRYSYALQVLQKL